MKADKKSAYAQRALGELLIQRKKYSDARTAFERFLSVAPTEAWRTQALAHSYYSLGDYAAARAHWSRAIVPRGLAPYASSGLGSRVAATISTR